jgi:galactokinase
MPVNRNQILAQHFSTAFDATPDLIVRAPGRVNLIGEHTDYNDGFVLPMAIDYDIRIAARARPDRTVRLYSVDLDKRDTFSLDDVRRVGDKPAWADYVRGVADVLQREGYTLRGMDTAITGNVPRASGLSSSAAMELAAITAFRLLSKFELDPVRAALLGQRAENEFVGMRCGIMDQFISSLGQADHALLIDCRSLEYWPVPLPDGVRVVVTDSGVRRGLVDSAYNERRAQCEEGARLMGVKALRDVSVEMFKAYEKQLPPVVARRCKHVVTEDQRTLDSVQALRRGDLVAFGKAMNESHASMRDWFEITTQEIDTLVQIQQDMPSCFGARMTGGGFGGCTVALVRENAVPLVVEAIQKQYPARTGKTPQVYVCRATQGAGLA